MYSGFASKLLLIPSSSIKPRMAIKLVFCSNPTAWLVSAGTAILIAWGRMISLMVRDAFSPRAAAASACVGAGAVLAEPEPLDAVDALRRWLEPGDRVLFKGSRGARVERMLQLLRTEVP